ncbi:MAG TPA: FecR domain-containing protein [Gemmatimonadaceae bacterium]|nr:FecR domain-containing protein [Gemmatimonadaceae bacterium]
MGHLTPTPPHDDSADWEAIARFFAGESSPEEAAVVRRWLEAHPEEAAALAALGDSTSKLVSVTPPDLDVEAALASVVRRRDAAPQADVIPIDSRRPVRRTVVPAATPARRWQRFALPAAAAAVLLVGGRFVWHSVQGDGYTPGPGTQPQIVATSGQRDSVTLSDGTRVLLAPGSRLTVAAGYGTNVREVQLEGEAYFDVRHDAARPFLVRASGAAIRDLGTTFTVRALGSQGVRVAVTSGSVSLASASAAPNAAVVLQPGDAGTFGTDGRALVERGGVTEPDTAWTRGRLVFREAPIGTVRSELRRWYGVELQVDSSLASRHLTMTVDGESADRVLETIALSLGAQVSRQGSVAVIKPAAPSTR